MFPHTYIHTYIYVSTQELYFIICILGEKIIVNVIIISVHHHLKDTKLFPYIFNFIIKPNLQIHYKNHNMPILLVKDKQ
jgi:low temperature requirement protein LtrA